MTEILSLSLFRSAHTKNLTKEIVPNFNRELQTGSSFRAIVSDITDNGDIIFVTEFGNFKARNLNNLKLGDVLSVKVLAYKMQDISVVITKINEANAYTKAHLIPINNVVNSTPNTDNTRHQVSSSILTLENHKLPNNVNGIVKYIDTANINDKSLIYQSFIQASSNPFTTIQIRLTDDVNESYYMSGLIVDSTNQTITIKTTFGIIEINCPLSVPIGSHIGFIIELVNESSILPKFTQQVMTFFFALSSHKTFIEDFFDAIWDHKNDQTNNQTSQSILTHQKRIENFLHLKSKYNDLKNALNLHNPVMNHLVPLDLYVKHDDAFQKQKIYIKKDDDKSVRFVISINLPNLGNVELAGHLQTHIDTTTGNLGKDIFRLSIKHESTFDEKCIEELSQIWESHSTQNQTFHKVTFEAI